MHNGVHMFSTYVTNIAPQLQPIEVNIGDGTIMEGFPNETSDSLGDLKLPNRIPDEGRRIFRRVA